MFYILLSNSTPNLSIGLDKVPLPDNGSDYGSGLHFLSLFQTLLPISNSNHCPNPALSILTSVFEDRF